MKIDVRIQQDDEIEQIKFNGGILDKSTGKWLDLVFIAVDDSTGQVIRYPENFMDYGKEKNIPLIVEFRDIEIVNVRN